MSADKPPGMLEMHDALMDATASLVAAISLLEGGGKKSAASDKMFEQMIQDYRGSVNRARTLMERLSK